MSFYDDVLRELIAALGAALFIGNLVALVRRHRDARRPVGPRPSPPGGEVRGEDAGPHRAADLAQAPLARTVLYMLLGLTIMVWGLATILVD